MLANLPENAKHLLLDIFNNIFNSKFPVPEQWTEYIIVPILKSGKPANLSLSYRPIALALCVLKTYKRILKNRLEFWIEKKNKYPKTQFGFRKGHSVQEAIASLITDIQIGFTENQSTSAVFLDVKGVYDI